MSPSVFNNKRNFPRYRLDVESDVTIAGKSLKAKVIDLSVEGVGIILPKSSKLTSPLIEVKINEIGCESRGQIVWTQNMISGLKVGIRKAGPLQGNLRNYRLSDILIGLKKIGRTGTLQIDSETVTKKIYFNKGNVIFSASNQDAERLGDMLLATGKINKEQFEKSVELMKKTAKRQGNALVELGYLKPEELIWAVQHQVERIILSLFNLDEGFFMFKDEPVPIDEVITLKLSTGNLIYRGINELDDPEILEKGCPSLDAVIYFASDPLNLYQDIALTYNDKKILSLIDGKRTIDDILAQSPLDTSETLKTLFALFNTQLIEVVEEGEVDTSINKEEILEETRPEMDSALADKIDKFYQEHSKLGYHGVLNISNDVSLDELRSAYHKMAKEFHPDRHMHLQSDALKTKLNTIFAYINEAYSVLANEHGRAQTVSAATRNTTPDDAAEEKESHDNKNLARKRFQEGKHLLNENNHEQAIVLFGQALYLDDSVAEYHYHYGIALYKQKKIKEAERSILKALQLHPNNSDYLASLGNIYLQLGFKIRAKNTFMKALSSDPNNARATEGLQKASA